MYNQAKVKTLCLIWSSNKIYEPNIWLFLHGSCYLGPIVDNLYYYLTNIFGTKSYIIAKKSDKKRTLNIIHKNYVSPQQSNP